ncbi:uncharacterized protein BJ212DRAFT_1303678 [Suillus subaureus]|uniref:Uncharacterized protein n=1 Tax=Suillus subaureus TaxID=48587 RepID=A0A9P7DZW9_9AGAM|nr:uncharacterized protein BJ212DRAFT_1303678 [Suillus subaureus]KAG1807036.1 hypothetical protein BJ212DRAFT_1303678 [Suillus subaureus]
MPITDDEKALGKDKSDIYAVIAKLIFANHTKYGPAYHQNLKKFCNSVTNHIVGLKTKYMKLKARFTAGAGVLPSSGHLLDSKRSETTKTEGSEIGKGILTLKVSVETPKHLSSFNILRCKL